MKKYTRGDAAAYYAWLGKQTGEVQAVAERFRPWEFYQLQGRDIYVQIDSYEPSGALVHVMREDGAIFAVIPHQIELAGLTAEELPANRLYQKAA